ncbi:Protein GST-6, partial [Aphelenchoides avenae]
TRYGKVPILEVDGKPLCQCYAISRYLARKFGLAGADAWEQARADEISDFHKEVVIDIAPYIYVLAGFRHGDKSELRKKVFIPAVDRNFPIYLALLKDSGSGFLLKSGVTWVDFVVSEYMTTIKHYEPEILEKYPPILKFCGEGPVASGNR